jgi:hypothetical protein
MDDTRVDLVNNKKIGIIIDAVTTVREQPECKMAAVADKTDEIQKEYDDDDDDENVNMNALILELDNNAKTTNVTTKLSSFKLMLNNELALTSTKKAQTPPQQQQRNIRSGRSSCWNNNHEQDESSSSTIFEHGGIHYDSDEEQQQQQQRLQQQQRQPTASTTSFHSPIPRSSPTCRSITSPRRLVKLSALAPSFPAIQEQQSPSSSRKQGSLILTIALAEPTLDAQQQEKAVTNTSHHRVTTTISNIWKNPTLHAWLMLLCFVAIHYRFSLEIWKILPSWWK